MNWDVAYTDLDSAIVNLQMYSGNYQLIGSLLDQLVNYIPIMLGVGIFLQVIGGLLVFFGLRPRVGGTFLAIYMICATLIYYPFWFYEGEQMTFNLVLFLKNLAILGGIFLLFGRRRPPTSNYEMLDDDM